MRLFLKWLLSRSVHTKIAATIVLVVAFFGIFVGIVNFYTVKTQTDRIVSEFVEPNLKSNEDFVVKSVLAKDYCGIYNNAIEASFKDGSINTVSSQNNQMTLISIEDNGVGIEEDIKKIFEPLFTTKEKSSGLRLFGV
jgi:signal transduction histidine kinase